MKKRCVMVIVADIPEGATLKDVESYATIELACAGGGLAPDHPMFDSLDNVVVKTIFTIPTKGEQHHE